MKTSDAAAVYDALGVRVFINAAGTYTRLGGSRMPPAAVAAMHAAAAHFVEIDELQARVGERIAALTGNEAAFVTSGAAAGLFIATAACMAGNDLGRARQLPDARGMRTQVVTYRAQRNPYDYAVRTLPVELVEIGFPNQIAPAGPWELEHYLTDQTLAVLYTEAGWAASGALPLQQVAQIAHQRSIPVIVDAAAQLPPRANLWRFTEMGADLVIFSGGKDLCGPQSSGLILGRKELISACALVGAPHHGVGRPFKVGKEELVGLCAAVEWYMGLDEELRAQRAERFVAELVAELQSAHVAVGRRFPNEAGQPIARAHVQFLGAAGPERCASAIAQLRAGNPSIEFGPSETVDGFYVNPMTLEPDEEAVVRQRLREVLATR